MRARHAGGAGVEEGGEKGRVGERETLILSAMQQAWLYAEACQWLLAFTLY